MNPMFVLVILFGLMVVAVIIFGAVFNAKVGGSSARAPWMRNVRGFQNQMENAGWRIQMIPYDDDARPLTISIKGLVGMTPVAGALGFIAGLAIVAYDFNQHVKTGLIVALASWLVALGGIWLKARFVQLDWDMATGRCIDRELQKVRAADASGQWTWMWRIVCEYEYLGIVYRVTPAVYWRGFASEVEARKYLAQRVGPQGECKLRVNPKNLRRTELLD